MSTSDKYMLLQQQADKEKRIKKEKEKSKKKKKKKGKKGKEDDSDEDEIPTVHTVSTIVDAPEGADLSDKEDDKLKNDQYKALDMNLDEPLRDDEILPVRTHHVVLESPRAGETNDESEAGAIRRKDSKKKSKKDKHKKEKVPKKEKKKLKRSESKDNGPSLLLAEEPSESAKAEETYETPEAESTKANGKSRETVEEKAGDDDLSFWLSKDTLETSTTASADSNTATSLPNGPPETNDGAGYPSKSKPRLAVENVVLSSDEDVEASHTEEKHKKKDKKVKKDKEKKDKKKEKKKLKSKRKEYEEADGITTPSKENISISQQPTPSDVKLPPMSSYLPLAESEAIRLTYETRINHQRSDQIVVSVVFCNLTKNTLKDLEFSVLDTLNTKLIRGIGQKSHDAIRVPFVLLPEAQNEGQFAFTVDNITMPQKLRGTLTYIVKTEEGSTQDKVDFRINLPCSTYLVATPSTSEEFSALLSGTEACEKCSLKFSPTETQLALILAKTCFYLHFRVVEQVDNSASLFSRSIQGHPVCLLVKFNEGSLSVDGKSSDQAFLSNTLDDMKSLLTQPPLQQLQLS
ncbi:hypothetical protein EGW08_010719 [Elysia chlorotica]|uniref:AP-3 complex subunit delta domain-containing protein n=1 Tax=Elysia chlorotica TaxID=188477 RepID=A0A3S1BIF5_ELYCH|nr:hypothetical protein EGW08_010719 [Elysia chlorotica]